jgi:hypothetical protein
MDADAWQVLSRHVTEPAFPDTGSGETLQALATAWRSNPDDPVSAQACAVSGDKATSEQVILSVAAGRPWVA